MAQRNNPELVAAIKDLDAAKRANTAAYHRINKILDKTPWADAMVDHVALLSVHGMEVSDARKTVRGWLDN